ncbi:MAG: PH domain-containing protein [Dehalococcoidia bacterium]|nr:PH domain-containing protein [Dehalococcoidia bacterium]MCA9857749.1 PH domain-containing protein [Dehalococcoidia bacterium]MCB9483783.1 PH domain-containing protein [Dehalococcoidia bacterium]MCB9492000.1 PH domain-containing protein [Dehalococcoidia bacterium]
MPAPNGTLRFPSKVDWWLVAILVLTPLPGIVVIVLGAIAGEVAAVVISLVTTLGLLGLYYAVIWPMEYLIEGDVLVIRAGRMRQRTPLADIVRIQPSRNILASPALSLDRLRIDRSRGAYLLLSPADRAGFAAAILERHPGVEVAPELLGGSAAGA